MGVGGEKSNKRKDKKQKRKCGCKSIEIKVNPPTSKRLMGNEILKIVLSLADKDAAGVGWVAAVE